MRYSLVNNPNKDYAPTDYFYYEITADIYNYSSESWSYEIVRNWFFTFKEAREYYLYHPQRIGERLYSNLHIHKCYKKEYPYTGVIQEQVL